MPFALRSRAERFLVSALLWCVVPAAWAEEPTGERLAPPTVLGVEAVSDLADVSDVEAAEDNLPVPPPDAPLEQHQPPPLPVGASAPPVGQDGQNGKVAGDGEVATIDLATALDLAGVRNPEILIARERTTEAVAVRQFAAAQILPNLNAGTSFDSHSGPVQQSSGHILKVSRSALFVGSGVNPVAAGTVNIPGLMWNQNLSQGLFTALVARQAVRQQQYTSQAVRNQVLRQVAQAYIELLRSAGRRALLSQQRDDATEIARVTRIWADTGTGRSADADRAAAELGRFEAELIIADGETLMASARLAQLLNLDPSVRLRPAEEWVVPTPLVPEPITLPELIGLAYLRRPEFAADRRAIEIAILNLRGAQVLPFSPTTLVGFSTGTFGGGSNLQATRFGQFGYRADFDVLAYWTLQNMGIQNHSQVVQARSRLRQANLARLQMLNVARAEVADAYARSRVRFAEIATTEEAVRASLDSFREDMLRTNNNEGLPIETLDSLRLLKRARFEYLDAIAGYNSAQFDLYVALGQPPADALARPAPAPRRSTRPAPAARRPPKQPTPAELAARIAPTAKVSRSYLPLRLWKASQADKRLAAAPPEAHLASAPSELPRPTPTDAAPKPHEAGEPRNGNRDAATIRRLSFVEPFAPPTAPSLPPGDSRQSARDGVSPEVSDEPPLPPAMPPEPMEPGVRTRAETVDAPPAMPASEREFVIDLPATVRLVVTANPTVAEARELVRETLALQSTARAMLLPSLNAGLMLHRHLGNLQASTGQIKTVYNDSFYYGGGARVVAAETVAIPAVRVFSHLGDALFEPLAVRQQVVTRRFDSTATANTMLLEGIIRYFELLRAEGQLEAVRQTERETVEIERLAATHAQTGTGRQGDADRARASALLVHKEVLHAEERVARASVRLAELLSLDPAVRLRTAGGPIAGIDIVDTSVGIEALLRQAERRRPELRAGSATIQHNATRVRQERLRPLFPLVMLGYSSGSYGGGGVAFPPLMGTFRGREDFDVMAVWSLYNMGVGNVATVAQRRAMLNQSIADRVRTLNDVRQQVIAGYALVKGEEMQIQVAQRQLSDSEQGFREEFVRLLNADTLPIEVLNSVNLLGTARQALVEAVVGYNIAQFRLFVATGSSPTRAATQSVVPASSRH